MAVAPPAIPVLMSTPTFEMLARVRGGFLSRTTRGRDVPADQEEFSIWMHDPCDAVYSALSGSLTAAMGGEGWEFQVEFDEDIEVHHYRIQRAPVASSVPAPRGGSGWA